MRWHTASAALVSTIDIHWPALLLRVTFASRGGEAVNGREIHTSLGFVLAIPLTLVLLSAQQSRIALLQLHQHVHGNDTRIAHSALGFAQPGYNMQRHY